MSEAEKPRCDRCGTELRGVEIGTCERCVSREEAELDRALWFSALIRRAQ